MAHKVILPKLGTNMKEAEIVSWVKNEGDVVENGDVLVEIETDKAVFELEAEYSGILRKILALDGTTVKITETIAIIADEDEDISALEKEITKEAVIEKTKYSEQTWQTWFAGEEEEDKEVRLSPKARRLVKEKRINLGVLYRHFGGERVLQVEDIEHFAKGEEIVIYGAGLGAKQALEIVRNLPNIRVVGLIDDNPSLWGKSISGYTVLGGFETLKEKAENGEIKHVALSFHSEVRRKIYLRIKEQMEIEIKTLVDPRAIISEDIEISGGVFIEAGAIIGPGTKIGAGVIVDVGAVVCHDCSIGPHCHLAPGCTLSGIVALEENVLVGVGASINSTVTIGKNVIVTPNSAVMNDVPNDVIISGVPARIIGKSLRGK